MSGASVARTLSACLAPKPRHCARQQLACVRAGAMLWLRSVCLCASARPRAAKSTLGYRFCPSQLPRRALSPFACLALFAVPLPCRRIRPSLLLPMSAVSLWLQGGAPRPSYRRSRWRRCASCLACRLSSSPAAITRQPPVPPPPPQTSFRASSSLLSRRRDHGVRFPLLPPAADPNRPGPSPSRGPMCLRAAARSRHRVRGPYRRHLRPDTARTRCTRRAAQSRPTPRSSAAA